MHQPYIATCQIWTSDSETIPIPILGVFETAEQAQQNAYAVLARLLTEQQPALLDKPVTVVVSGLSDDATREFLAMLGRHRPDLLRTPRGKATP